jgi:Ankyrin repeats (many copies)
VTEGDGHECTYTPLHMAARANHLRCMIFLLQKDSKGRQEAADVNATFGRHEFNALALAKDSPCVNVCKQRIFFTFISQNLFFFGIFIPSIGYGLRLSIPFRVFIL